MFGWLRRNKGNDSGSVVTFLGSRDRIFREQEDQGPPEGWWGNAEEDRLMQHPCSEQFDLAVRGDRKTVARIAELSANCLWRASWRLKSHLPRSYVTSL